MRKEANSCLKVGQTHSEAMWWGGRGNTERDLRNTPFATYWLCGPGESSPLQLLVSHLYSKGLKQKLSSISTKQL